MDPSILIKPAVEAAPYVAGFAALTVAFVAVLRVGVFAWSKLGEYAIPVLTTATLASMAILLPGVNLVSVFDAQVFPGFFILHVCGGTIVCSIIAKWVEDKARKDLERELLSQRGE